MTQIAFNPQLLKVPLYVAGKSAEEVRAELGLDEVLKLASNESPLGPSPLALAALQEAASTAHRYPGNAECALRQKLAVYHGNGLTENHFIIGNGATDILRMVAQGFVFDRGNTIFCRVSFPLYGLLTTMYGGESIRVEPGPDLHFDLEAMAAAVDGKTRIIWLCSPNNPTGYLLTQTIVDDFLARIPKQVVVVFDESYCDFVSDPEYADSISYVRAGYNVVVVRSFSKFAGLANLRVGYGVARPYLIEYLMHTVVPFNTGGPVLQAAAASLDDHDYQDRSRELVLTEREFLFESFSEMGLTCLPSQTNFVLVVDPPGGATALAEVLLLQGIIVRPMGGFGLPNAIRVTIGTREQNEELLGTLRSILESAQEIQAVP